MSKTSRSHILIHLMSKLVKRGEAHKPGKAPRVPTATCRDGRFVSTPAERRVAFLPLTGFSVITICRAPQEASHARASVTETALGMIRDTRSSSNSRGTSGMRASRSSSSWRQGLTFRSGAAAIIALIGFRTAGAAVAGAAVAAAPVNGGDDDGLPPVMDGVMHGAFGRGAFGRPPDPRGDARSSVGGEAAAAPSAPLPEFFGARAAAVSSDDADAIAEADAARLLAASPDPELCAGNDTLRFIVKVNKNGTDDDAAAQLCDEAASIDPKARFSGHCVRVRANAATVARMNACSCMQE